MTGGGNWRRTVDIDMTASARGWHMPNPPPYRAVRRRWSGRGIAFGMLLPMMAAGTFVLGMFVGLPRSGMAQPAYWHSYVPGAGGAALEDAIVTGGESGLALYSCRASVGGAVQIGRYRRDFGGCHVGLAGKEIEATPFELLSAQWRDAPGAVGPAALIAGQMTLAEADPGDGVSVHPCRASYQNGKHPGYVTARGDGCTFGYGGKTVTSQNFAVLQAAPWLTWTAAVPQNLPDSALAGGQEGGEALYVCRAPDPHGLLAGKLRRSSPGCSIASDGREVIAKRFEVLVPRWTVSAGGGVPVGAVPVGHDTPGLLYLCRGQNRAMLQPGRLSETLTGCHVGMQGGDNVLQDYEVLTQ